jgi:transposase-like protein
MNRIQFQSGLSLPDFLKQFGNEIQCEVELERTRWPPPQGFVCPCCDHTDASVFRVGSHPTFQCKICRHQTSLIAGTLFESTKLPLTLWFLAIYLISQAKTGLSALALKRLLGVSYPTAWLLQHKLMATMSERDANYPLSGKVDIDDAYLGGRQGGTWFREQSAVCCGAVIR